MSHWWNFVAAIAIPFHMILFFSYFVLHFMYFLSPVILLLFRLCWIPWSFPNFYLYILLCLNICSPFHPFLTLGLQFTPRLISQVGSARCLIFDLWSPLQLKRHSFSTSRPLNTKWTQRTQCWQVTSLSDHRFVSQPVLIKGTVCSCKTSQVIRKWNPWP